MKLSGRSRVTARHARIHDLFAPLSRRACRRRAARRSSPLRRFRRVVAYDVSDSELMWRRKFDSFTRGHDRYGGTLCPGGRRRAGHTATRSIAARGCTPCHGTTSCTPWTSPPVGIVPPEVRAAQRQPSRSTCSTARFTPRPRKGAAARRRVLSPTTSRRTVRLFAPAGGGMGGRRGVTINPEGRVFLGTGDAVFDDASKSLGNAIVSVKMAASRELELVDYYAPPNANWMFRAMSRRRCDPGSFDHQGRKPSVGTSEECPIWLLDHDNLGGRSPNGAVLVAAALRRRAGFDAHGVWRTMAASVDGRGRSGWSCRSTGRFGREFEAARGTPARPTAASRPTPSSSATAAGSWCRSRCRATWTWPDMPSSPTACCSCAPAARTPAGFPEHAFDDPRGAQLSRAVGNSAPRRLEGRKAALYYLDTLSGEELWTPATPSPPGILQRADGGRRRRLPDDVRRHDLRLRRGALEGPTTDAASLERRCRPDLHHVRRIYWPRDATSASVARPTPMHSAPRSLG